MDSAILFTLMTWTLGILATAVVGLIIWFVLKIVSQVESLKDLVTGPGESHERRIGRLEDWKEMVSPPHNHGSKGTRI